MENSPQKPHAILVTYPLQGHVIPSVNLAIKLASRGFTITFITTQFIHHKTIKAQSKDDDDNDNDVFAAVRKSGGLDIRYKIIPDGLPVGFDRSLNHDQFMAALLHVFSAHVEEAVMEILNKGPPVSCLVADTFFVWPARVARKYGILYVSFWTEPALVFTLYYHVELLRLNSHFGRQGKFIILSRKVTLYRNISYSCILIKDTNTYMSVFILKQVLVHISFLSSMLLCRSERNLNS